MARRYFDPRNAERDRPPRNIFYDRMYELVNDPSSDSIISWSRSNESFVVWNPEELIRRKMHLRFFCHTFAEFISTVKHYGFREVKGSGGLWEFGNKNFVRGQPELMSEMYSESVMARFMAKCKAWEAKEQVEDRMPNLTISSQSSSS